MPAELKQNKQHLPLGLVISFTTCQLQQSTCSSSVGFILFEQSYRVWGGIYRPFFVQNNYKGLNHAKLLLKEKSTAVIRTNSFWKHIYNKHPFPHPPLFGLLSYRYLNDCAEVNLLSFRGSQILDTTMSWQSITIKPSHPFLAPLPSPLS